MALTSAARMCAHHPRVQAGWHCQVCAADFCADCAAVQKAGLGEITVCIRCRQVAVPLTAHRSATPYQERIGKGFAAALTPDGLILMAGTGAVTWLIGMVGELGALMAYAIGWAVSFGVLRRTAIGAPPFHTPDFTDFFGDLVVPAVRATVASAIAFVPALAYASTRPDHLLDLGDPLAWGVLLIGAAYLPMALMIAASETHVAQLLNPLMVLGNIARFRSVYWLAAAITAGLGIAQVQLGHIATALATSGIPVIPGLVARMVDCYLTFTMCHLLGLLLFVHGDRVGFGPPADYLEPLVVGSPRGAPIASLEASTAEAAPRSYAPIELEGPHTAITQALERRDLEQAIDLYRQGGVDLKELGAERVLQLGQAAAGKGELQLALELLAAVRSLDTGETAARALVIAGRLYSERLHNPQAALKQFREVVTHFPGGQAAEFALGRLKELAGADGPLDPAADAD